MPMTNCSPENPPYLQLLEQLGVGQLCELIAAIGGTCAGANYGTAGNTELGAALLRAAVVMFESNRCKVEFTIDSSFWESPAYYKSGMGACLAEMEPSPPCPEAQGDFEHDHDPDNF